MPCFGRWLQLVLAAVAVLAISRQANGEVFSALTHLSSLVESEQLLAQLLQDYIASQEKRLDRLKDFATLVKYSLRDADTVPLEEYVSHPTNAFALVRRFAFDWKRVQESLKMASIDNIGLKVILESEYRRYPNVSDLDGTARAVLRLQETYKLNVSQLADGMAAVQGLRLPLRDIFGMAIRAHEDKEYLHCKRWMQECLRRLYAGERFRSIKEQVVIEYLAFCEYKLGNIQRAIRWSKKHLRLVPGSEKVRRNLRIYLKIFQKQLRNGTAFSRREVSKEDADADADTLRYNRLCRAAQSPPGFVAEKQICFYTNRNRNPNLILRPAKVEVAWVKPTILIYRDILSQTELKTVKKLTKWRLQRSLVGGIREGKVSNIRVSQGAWVLDKDDPSGVVAGIGQRIGDYTDLDMDLTEKFQVVNYGIGGQYAPHFDFLSDITTNETGTNETGTDGIGPCYRWNLQTNKTIVNNSCIRGDRIATVLLYLSNVKAGGCTVFPDAGARIEPSMGDATFWYNLQPSGEGDMMTRHAGCPVLTGSKWIANAWINEAQQELRHPCKLDEFAEWDIHLPPEHV